METSIKEKIISIIADKSGFDITGIKKEDRFREDLSFDSLDQVELCMDIEKEFNIAFTDQEMEKISTVQDAIDQVELRLPK